ncbi:MAG: DNA-processing protein DprA [Candidatus Eremiobacteraeota bacterium]|nr:DNA-processing protein DprA [Candidatus Eremiobacteraeota bacterium]
MSLDDPVFDGRDAIERARGERGFASEAPGLWRAGTLQPLERPSVAVVGTRAATSYGRRLARAMAADLGAAGCCIVSGLALGIDAAAHEGALEAGAPTVGVLGSGHRRFFPARNAALAARIVAGGGAVLSPYPPDHDARPGQFLERNGVVAALADAVVVVEAPARSGALNTAGWAAGRIPVLAVPGDVDRRHVMGCHALIRDGATLARDAADVLEALGRSGPSLRAIPQRAADPAAAALLAAIDGGTCALDDLLAATDLAAGAALAALALLELDGAIERSGPASYVRAASAMLRR